ncbi:MAG: Flp pilus assembly complex ATPase component TadA [Candidatus Omnitrophica bacterium]|nr:Flp pilus assembly complex ATPase component TadA [Candidatus Omnitrophota bacterium]
MVSLKERLTEILIKNKIITRENLDKAIAVQSKEGGRLSDILVRLGYVDQKDLVIALSEGLGLPPIDLNRFKIESEVTKLIPQETARHYQIIPVSKMGNTLTLAMADPLNVFAIDAVKTLTGFDINPIIAKPEDVMNAITQYYGEDSYQAIEDIIDEMGKDSELEVIKDEKIDYADVQELARLTQEAPVIKITNLFLKQGIEARASDILIEPFEKSVRVRLRVDGMLKEIESPPRSLHASVVSRIKVMSGMDIAEHRLPQDGRFKIKLEGKDVDFRVSVLPSSFGEKVALRILDKTTAKLDITQLGFDKHAVEVLKKSALKPHGMILTCGPTGSGKTTTLYSLLKFIDAPDKNIITVEDPVEYQLRGINQVTVNVDIGLTFASCLRSILRQDPDIIMVGEIRDFETVDISIKAALTGHLVLSTLHTTTAPGSVIRLGDMGVEPFLITSSVIAVMSQRLLRKLCERCKEEIVVKEEVSKKVGIKTGTKVFAATACKNCLNTGYAGRLGIIEILELTPKVKELILGRVPEDVIKKAAREEGMKTLQEAGIEKVIEGLTSIDEVVRLTAPDKEMA